MWPLPDLSHGPDSSRILFTLLPGSDRKRDVRAYRYRLTYRNSQPDGTGCVMTWEVSGGRLIYQIALEREENGGLRCHCTCADAVYRAENEGRYCKHVLGLLEFGRPARNLPQVLQRRGA
jgi:hypothetical protein